MESNQVPFAVRFRGLKLTYGEGRSHDQAIIVPAQALSGALITLLKVILTQFKDFNAKIVEALDCPTIQGI